jgi:2-keto-4-pentenoate hydratase/2-oxohepta-3-ene-1,7-dioic acid hydratase in catechol pathway
MNDVSERKLKIWERSSDRPKDAWFDWLNGKWCDTFAPMGPWLVTSDEISDPHGLTISTYVNGELKQNCSTADMIFKIPELIAYISSIVTLEPGDVISTGTIAGVGASSGEFLKPGDNVKINITSIGTLHSTVRSENE